MFNEEGPVVQREAFVNDVVPNFVVGQASFDPDLERLFVGAVLEKRRVK